MNRRSHASDATERTPRVCNHADDPCKLCRGIAGMRVMHSEELLQGQRELLIVHGGQIYRLLRTRNDKLILQK
jgi:hemin uptake protein HemP